MKASIHLLGGNGYVWDADAAHWLRLECGLMGAMVGGMAAFKQQNAVHGLPLELSPEEVTLALERGWAELQPALDTAQLAATGDGSSSGAGRKRGRDYQYDEFYDGEEMEEEGGYGEQDAAAAAVPEPAWRAALANGSALDIPTTRDQALAANCLADSGSGAGSSGGGEAVQWCFPASEDERHRYWVFRDLHSKGFRLTGGSKFGADYLVYPGDPTLYHAQFCVRLMPFNQPILPAMLASATRGSHQARKHLLIASVVEREAATAAGGVDADAGGAVAAAAASAAVEAPVGAPGCSGEAQVTTEGQQQDDEGEGEQQGAVQVGQGSGPQLGSVSGGTGNKGEQYRIHYMTIGPVEGFG